jgi:tetratricopeptide (TPR) repeat protein
MRCSHAKKFISEYIDGDLGTARKARLEDHLSQCSDCRKVLKDLKNIVTDAQRLEEPSPPDNTWQKIESRLESRQPLVTFPELPSRKWFALPGFRYTLAAAAVVLIVIGVLTLGPFSPQPGGIVPEIENQDYTLAKLEEAEQHYQKAIKALGEAVAARQERLDPQVAEILQANLEIIDKSISACREAVLSNPTDLDSRNYLLAAYKEKADLLHQVVNLNGNTSPAGKSDTTL